jgi:predicted O-methyltransferase YrrM
VFNFRRKSEYSFTPGRDWFNYSEIKREIHKYVDSSRRLVILEIGVFEGLSTMFLADKLLKDPFSKLIAIDPFNSNIDNDHFELLQVENGYSIVEQRFLTNLAKNKKRRQIELLILFFQAMNLYLT